MDKRKQDIEEVINIQKYDGNWNYDPYMHGLLNGMLMVESIANGCKEYKLYLAPKRWKYRRWYERVFDKVMGRNKLIQIKQ